MNTNVIYNRLRSWLCNVPFFSFTIPLNITFLDTKFHILKASFLWVLAWHRRSIQFMYRTRKIEFWLDCSGLLRICSWRRQPSRLKTPLREFFVSPSSYVWKRKLLLSTGCVARLVQHGHTETRTSKSRLRYWMTKEVGGYVPLVWLKDCCDVMWFGRDLPLFQNNKLPPCCIIKMQTTKFTSHITLVLEFSFILRRLFNCISSSVDC
jgi:hypothetical protein